MRLSNSQRQFLLQATQQYASHIHLAEQYLQSRGFTVEEARKFHLGVVKDALPGHEQYINRLAIPYLTPAGVVDIRFRSLNGDGPKYLTRPGAESHVYNVMALNQHGDTLVVCEGELDTIIATQAGFKAVGLPGANTWKGFYSRLFGDWEKIMLFCDGDNAGREMAKSITRELDNVIPVFMPEGQDVNDVYLAEGADGLHKRVGV